MDKVDNQSTMKTAENKYILDRKAACRLLKISTRTLDRYLKANKLTSRIESGRIRLDKAEVRAFREHQVNPVNVDNVDTQNPKMSIDNDVDNVDNVDIEVDNNVDNVEIVSRKRPGSFEKQVYKKLFLELKEELNEKQGRLEIANYRVGQLEAQVKSSIPMLEYHRENYEKKQKEEQYEKQLSDKTSVIKKISVQLKYEKFNKRIFLIILLTILALQPLWLLIFNRF